MATQKKTLDKRVGKSTTNQGADIGGDQSSKKAEPSEGRVIKKYPNRRLYDTQTSTYVTLSDIKKLVMAQERFHVIDAKTNENLTRSILMQIILEEESAGTPLFSTEALSQMIRFYGHSLQGMMSPFLEKNLSGFIDMQNQFTAQSKQMGQAMTPESWMKFMQQQSPETLGSMSGYMEQGKKFFEQMQSQTTNLFGSFPFAGNPAKSK
jgi:polyhydroxyalkanoate synthesis repressor PhaR